MWAERGPARLSCTPELNEGDEAASIGEFPGPPGALRQYLQTQIEQNYTRHKVQGLFHQGPAAGAESAMAGASREPAGPLPRWS